VLFKTIPRQSGCHVIVASSRVKLAPLPASPVPGHSPTALRPQKPIELGADIGREYERAMVEHIRNEQCAGDNPRDDAF
jgi:hypothetical protein